MVDEADVGSDRCVAQRDCLAGDVARKRLDDHHVAVRNDPPVRLPVPGMIRRRDQPRIARRVFRIREPAHVREHGQDGGGNNRADAGNGRDRLDISVRNRPPRLEIFVACSEYLAVVIFQFGFLGSESAELFRAVLPVRAGQAVLRAWFWQPG